MQMRILSVLVFTTIRTTTLSILRNIIPAMKHGARLVVMDTVLPEPKTVGQSEERLQQYAVLGVDVK